MAERLTIKSGELNFYEEVYCKCSNKNSPEVIKKAKKKIPYYNIEEYKYKQYTSKELSDIYTKLSKLEDILEKYDLEVEELDERIYNGAFNYIDKLKAETERDTWKRACELAVLWIAQELKVLPKNIKKSEFEFEYEVIIEENTDYFYQQAKEN